MDGGVTPTRCATERIDTALACPVSSSNSVAASRISSRSRLPKPRGALARRRPSIDTLTNSCHRLPDRAAIVRYRLLGRFDMPDLSGRPLADAEPIMQQRQGLGRPPIPAAHHM